MVWLSHPGNGSPEEKGGEHIEISTVPSFGVMWKEGVLRPNETIKLQKRAHKKMCHGELSQFL